jgi:2,3-dihydroxy-p-cumate/2,3-dihydroxybenzoate 3,4-dioxygenase
MSVRYRKLGYVELNVTDLDTSRRFYEDIVGLQFIDRGEDGEVRLRCDDDHHNLVLHRGKRPGLKRVGWMLEDASQFAILHAALARREVAYRELDDGECRRRLLRRATRVVEPASGATMEFYLPADERPYRFVPTVAKIQRIGHAVIRTRRYHDAVDFTRQVLNFAVSDSVGEAVTFLRCFPNPYHHGFGIANAPENGWHHLNLMVSEIDDIGRALNRLEAAGVPIVYGPGRHPPSDSVFLYWLDPDGMTVEYSFGMEEFPEATARSPRHMRLTPNAFDYWGGRPDPRMATGGELESATL